MHGSCLSIPRTGGLKIKLFDEGENVWDFHRGRALDTKFKEETAKDMKALDRLGAMLRQSALRPGSRTNYNAWFRAWLAFCKQKGCRPLPAKQKPLLRFLTTLAMHYAVSSVKIAASAVVAVHRLNNKKNPFRNAGPLVGWWKTQHLAMCTGALGWDMALNSPPIPSRTPPVAS